MAVQDRLHWDAIYKVRVEEPYPDPDPLLYQYVPPLREAETATALDLAAGVGQNGLWLAAQGYTVDLVDISRVALTRAQVEASWRSLRNINFFQLDLDDAGLEPEAFQVVCVFRFLDRKLLPSIRAAVKPGGRILYQTFNMRYLESQPDMKPDYLLGLGELAGYFGDWRILRSSEHDHISQLVAIKPGG